ncbi:MAG: hypothetical protein AAF367_08350 [Pseudomonadota bacterium]
MAGAKLRVVFAYRAIQKARGSKIMRVDQLCAMAALHLGHLYDFEQVQLHGAGKPRQQRKMIEHLRGAIVIFLKGSARNFDRDGMDALRHAVRAICVDYLDSPFAGRFFRYVDTHIVASLTGTAALRNAVAGIAPDDLWSDATVAHLTHHADPRLMAGQSAGSDMRVAYFGMAENTFVPEEIAAHIAVPDDDIAFRDMLLMMENTHLHYAIRSSIPLYLDGKRIYKPFTKGFNAARAGANVLVDRAADDAIAYLGEDYPFLARSNRAADVVEAFRRAEDAYGGPEWARAATCMEDVRRRSAPEAVMRELRAILARFD